jgi:hypothetical protein
MADSSALPGSGAEETSGALGVAPAEDASAAPVPPPAVMTVCMKRRRSRTCAMNIINHNTDIHMINVMDIINLVLYILKNK